MRTLLLMVAAACAVAAASFADVTNSVPSEPIAVTLLSDGTTNTWTQADLIAALQLINRKYHRDCERAEGRKAWHGKMHEVITTNGEELVKTEIHEDGQQFTFKSRYIPPAVSVSNGNARLSTTMTRGIPRELAKARLRRAQEKNTVSNVTVSVEANVR